MGILVHEETCQLFAGGFPRCQLHGFLQTVIEGAGKDLVVDGNYPFCLRFYPDIRDMLGVHQNCGISVICRVKGGIQLQSILVAG